MSLPQHDHQGERDRNNRHDLIVIPVTEMGSPYADIAAGAEGGMLEEQGE